MGITIIIDRTDQLRHQVKIRYKRTGYNLNIMRESAYLLINPTTVNNFVVLFNCTPVDRASDSVTAQTLSYSFRWFGPRLFHLLFHHSTIMITCPCNVYPLTPHFYIVKVGFTRVYIFLIFTSKHRLWELVRTASLRRF